MCKGNVAYGVKMSRELEYLLCYFLAVDHWASLETQYLSVEWKW